MEALAAILLLIPILVRRRGLDRPDAVRLIMVFNLITKHHPCRWAWCYS